MSLGRLSSLLVALPLANAASSATFISSDLTSKPSLENIKATWDTDLEVAGNKAKLSLLCAPENQTRQPARPANLHARLAARAMAGGQRNAVTFVRPWNTLAGMT